MKGQAQDKRSDQEGNQGQPGPAYPKCSRAYINLAGDLPRAGINTRGQFQGGAVQLDYIN